MTVPAIRSYFSQAVQVCMAIGGWGDTAGFGIGATNDTTRKLFAQNVATTLTNLGYDCVGE
jgi:chitinase